MTKAIENPPGLKRCCRCKETKPVDQYVKNRGRADGLHPVCKPCRRIEYAGYRERSREKSRLWYHANRTRVLQEQRDWRRANPEAAKAKARQGYLRNREKRLAATREYQQKNRERLNAARRRFFATNPERKTAVQAYRSEYNRQARAADPERYNEYARQRRARVRAAPTMVITSDLLEAKWTFWNGRCWVCGSDATEWDHIKPLSKGGAHMLCNLRPACRSCNAQKSASWPLAA